MASPVPAPAPGAPRRGAQGKAPDAAHAHAAQAPPAPKSKSSHKLVHKAARVVNAPATQVLVGGFCAWLACGKLGDTLGGHVVTAADRLGGHGVTAADRLGGHIVTAADRLGKHCERVGVVAGTRIGAGLTILGLCTVAATRDKP